MWWLWILINSLLAIIPGLIARQRGGSFFRYWCYSFFFSFLIGLVLTFVLCKKQNVNNDVNYIPINEIKGSNKIQPEENIKRSDRPLFCGDCGKPIAFSKKYCVYCGSSVEYD